MFNILSITFWILPSSKRLPPIPDGAMGSLANGDEISEAIADMLKKGGKNGKGLHSDKNLKRFSRLADALLKSNSQYKFGSVFFTLASALAENVVNDKHSHVPLGHYNEKDKSNNQITITKTFAHMGRPYSRKLRSYIDGPVHDKFTKLLLDTRQDFKDPKYKVCLNSYAGVNQRNYTFLDSRTYLSMQDINILTNFQESHHDLLEKEYLRLLKQLKKTFTESENGELLNKIARNRLKSRSDNRVIKHYAALLGQKTQIKIYNRIPVYDVHAMVHLVRFNSYESRDMTTIDDLLEDIQWRFQSSLDTEQKQWLSRIPSEKVKKQTRSKTTKFSQQLHTTLDVNVRELESFKKNCTVVKSWARKIPSGGIWEFNLREKFSDGIYLNKVHELNSMKIKADTPVNHFYMIEYYGDRRASVFRNVDKSTFPGVYSPVMVGYDVKFEIEHLSKVSSQDEIASYEEVFKSKEFLDDSLSLEFYPDRGEYLNVDIDNVSIGNPEENKSKKNPEFRLELNSSILENQNLSQIESMMKRIALVDKVAADALSEDDIPFMGKNSSETASGLRGGGDNEENDSEPPYSEDEHR